jgi:hypothetical protein
MQHGRRLGQVSSSRSRDRFRPVWSICQPNQRLAEHAKRHAKGQAVTAKYLILFRKISEMAERQGLCAIFTIYLISIHKKLHLIPHLVPISMLSDS